jgi:hypothetical protein
MKGVRPLGRRDAGMGWSSDHGNVQPSAPGDVTVVIPELPIGTYRLVRHHQAVGDLYRVIWITDALSGIRQEGSDGSSAP